MNKLLHRSLQFARAIPGFLWQHKYHTGACLLLLLWCLPYFTTGERIEWGDFSFFTQAYEAIRRSILEYGQFPWFNPWVAGGVPLYANPQMGVFSIQTPLVLLFGAPVGLKLAIVIYTFAGYASMYVLLRRYFKVVVHLATLLSLVWIFSTFFVAHLPSHFTFVWYMLAPLYVYLALTLRTWRDGLWLGAAFGVMALSAVHNPFFHISFVVGIILLVRIARQWREWRRWAKALATAAGVFLVIAGHRTLMAIENVKDFPREVVDPAAQPWASILGIIMPYSNAHNLWFLERPTAPYGFGEVTATIGIFALFTVFLGLLFIAYRIFSAKQWLAAFKKSWLLPGAVFGLALVFFAIGVGPVHEVAPYSLIKHIPVFGEMRVSSRWFLWSCLALLVFIGIMYQRAAQRSFFRFTTVALVSLGVLELFVVNFGYQSNVLSHDLIKPKHNTTNDPFEQTHHLGTGTLVLPNGKILEDDGQLPNHYREYEATLFNLGVIQANDALVDNNTIATPRCGWEKGCRFVMSGNAVVDQWSPHRIVLQRTAEGPIELNMNNSSYFVINGKRDTNLKVAEPRKDFIITDPSEKITIEVRPSFLNALRR